MIVYRELPSLCNDLGFSARALYAASNTINKRYHLVKIPKADGDYRELHVPDDFLKSIQRSIAKNILAYEPISPYACAYRINGSTALNACTHVGEPTILKLDIRKFFDHITYPMVKEKVFPAEKYSEQNRILLSILCVYSQTVPQGAPTSPAISNIILREFDDRVGEWCKARNINYTRYCDDMTFSGSFDAKELKQFVENEIQKEGFFINAKKTVVLHDGQRKAVTGIVVNEKLSVQSEYKKDIRKIMYYCNKYGVIDHMMANKIIGYKSDYLNVLLGKINYVLSVEKNNKQFIEYRSQVKKWLAE